MFPFRFIASQCMTRSDKPPERRTPLQGKKLQPPLQIHKLPCIYVKEFLPKDLDVYVFSKKRSAQTKTNPVKRRGKNKQTPQKAITPLPQKGKRNLTYKERLQ